MKKLVLMTSILGFIFVLNTAYGIDKDYNPVCGKTVDLYCNNTGNDCYFSYDTFLNREHLDRKEGMVFAHNGECNKSELRSLDKINKNNFTKKSNYDSNWNNNGNNNNDGGKPINNNNSNNSSNDGGKNISNNSSNDGGKNISNNSSNSSLTNNEKNQIERNWNNYIDKNLNGNKLFNQAKKVENFIYGIQTNKNKTSNSNKIAKLDYLENLATKYLQKIYEKYLSDNSSQALDFDWESKNILRIKRYNSNWKRVEITVGSNKILLRRF